MAGGKFNRSGHDVDLIDQYFSKQAKNYGNNDYNIFWPIIRRIESSAILKMTGDLENKVCLDIGCGNGFYSNLMIMNGAKLVTCVDRNKSMLDQIVHPSMTKILGDAETFLTSRQHDIALFAGVLEFLDTPITAIKNVTLHCKKESRLIALVPSVGVLTSLYSLFHQTHGFEIKRFSESSLTKMLNDSGWCIENIEYSLPFSLVVSAVRYV